MALERLDELWVRNDYPVLLEAVRRATTPGKGGPYYASQIEQALSETQDRLAVQGALSRLAQYGYLRAETGFPNVVVRIHGVTEKAIRATGVWPRSDAGFDELMDFLDQQTESAPAEEQPQRKRLRQAFTEVGEDITAKVIAELIARSNGM